MKIYKCKKGYVVCNVVGPVLVIVLFACLLYFLNIPGMPWFLWPGLTCFFFLFYIIPRVKNFYNTPTEIHEDYVQFPFDMSIYQVEYRDVRSVKYYGRKGKPYCGCLRLMFSDGSKVDIGNAYDDFPELCRTVIDNVREVNPQVIIDDRAKKYLYPDSLK